MLSGKNIKLRALEPADVDLLYNWENDTSIWQISNTLTPYSRHVLEQYVLNSHLDIYTTKQLRLIIEYSGSSKPIGCVDIFDFDPFHERAGIGILIANKSDQGKGLASDALSVLIPYAFKKLNLHQLYCTITSGNESSINLFIRHGFKQTGLKKQWLNQEGVWKDELFLQLLNEK